LSESYAIIDAAKALVGGRAVILECERSESLVAHYEKHNFNVLIDNPKEALITLYTFIA